MSTDLEHGRFCPYCGRQLGKRSKFCPHCGKASPRRQRVTGSVDAAAAVAMSPQAGQGVLDSGHATPSDRLQTRTAKQRPNGAPRPAHATAGAQPISVSARRYAPPTHSLIGAFEQAGFGLRYGAWMFDFLITLIAMMVFTFMMTAMSRRSVVGSNVDLVIVAGLTVLLLVMNLVVLAGSNGQTAGMRILGIYIVRVDGSRFTRKRAALRHLVGYPLSMAGFFLGFLWMLWDPRQQGWHDKLASTIVVMSRRMN
jgi:uncharacterized RDD family membrane protein YckC